MHTHGPQQGAPPAQQQQQQQQMAVRPPDPLMQAVIEESHIPVDTAIGSDNASVLCEPHKLEKCADCDLDFTAMNKITKQLLLYPTYRCPPPPTVVTQLLSQGVNTKKEEGNILYRNGQHTKAIQQYTVALNLAAQRPGWEAHAFTQTEFSTILSNRSAAYFESKDYINALVDAETVIQIRRNWSKGHFRKARTLMKMECWEEAKDVISVGLVFEPGNAEMIGMLAEIETAMKKNENDRRLKREGVPPALAL